MKIVITGPESTGKTTLAKELSKHFEIPFVEEYARGFLENLNHPYKESDLINIAKGQLALEEKSRMLKPKLLLCDTDLLTIKVWSEYKYQRVNPDIVSELDQNKASFYLLCSPDIEWEVDNQREHPQNREELFYIYENELKQIKVPFGIVTGQGQLRVENAIALLSPYL